ncbi:MAG: hypothetical protein CBB95_17610 [Alteromonas sp. TMED35]|jgi:hypothetical protein|uniref:hypothetical protein n=1 Tax=uncultured Alteromonas sp. TaxID=179113 RepID=UPI000B753B12|nr:MAG: hypothetical protein CBB95_17610 [Alteromonas sp. TMED35]|tara:strand:- start:20340 stop:21851 length:1512 start_codon:yes stop_codon:yes gene_type:complete
MNKRTYRKNIALTALTKSGKDENQLIPLSKREKIALNTVFLAVHNSYFLKYPELEQIGRQNIKLSHVQERSGTFKIDEALLMKSLGYVGSRSGNKGQVLDVLKDLSGAVLAVDGFGIARSLAQDEKWEADDGFAVLIASAFRPKDGYFHIEIPSVVLHRIINPEISIYGLEDWSNFKSKNTPDLIDTLEYYWEKGDEYTDWFDLETLKKNLGIAKGMVTIDGNNRVVATSETYEKWGRINAKIIKKIKEDVEKNTDIAFNFEVETDSAQSQSESGRGRGRVAVTHVRFKLIPKPDDKCVTKSKSVVSQLQRDAWAQRLMTLGIAKNQVDGVIEQVEIEDSLVKAEFINYALSKGEHYHRLKSMKGDFNFGGWFRKHILRNSVADWLETRATIIDVLVNNENIENPTDKQIKAFREKLSASISQRYLSLLCDTSFVQLKSEFEDWLTEEYEKPVATGEEQINLTNLTPEDTMFVYFEFFLEVKYDLFKPIHYSEELTTLYGDVL